MTIQTALFKRPAPERLPKPRTDFPVVSEAVKGAVMIFIALWTFVAAFFFNTPAEILQGLERIQRSPGILLTDFMAVGNIGAALVNGALALAIGLVITAWNKVSLSGPIIAGLFLMSGFAFFGKNLYNIWPIMAGVALYAKLQREDFRTVILLAFFGTALGPLVSQVTFGMGLPLPLGIPLGILAGVTAGMMLPPLGSHFIRFHQGYNLYNVGFTTGIIGMVFMAVFQGFDIQNLPTALLRTDQSTGLIIYLAGLFAILLLIGLGLSKNPGKSLWDLWQMPGQLVSDFVQMDGFGIVLVNMAILGFVSMAYVLMVGAAFNGPVLGAIFTVVGFGAFGKHLKNILPVMAGVYLANLIFIWEADSITSVLAALFATTLAPIAGAYGVVPGVLAGFLHMAIVMNVGYLHGGMNLYNNGFSGGFVAAVMVPILDSIYFSLSGRKERL